MLQVFVQLSKVQPKISPSLIRVDNNTTIVKQQRKPNISFNCIKPLLSEQICEKYIFLSFSW